MRDLFKFISITLKFQFNDNFFEHQICAKYNAWQCEEHKDKISFGPKESYHGSGGIGKEEHGKCHAEI